MKRVQKLVLLRQLVNESKMEMVKQIVTLKEGLKVFEEMEENKEIQKTKNKIEDKKALIKILLELDEEINNQLSK